MKQKTMKKLILTSVVSSAMLWAATGHSTALVDFQNGQGALSVGAFDWGQTSFVAVGGNQAIQNWVTSGGACPNNSCDFDILTHARLNAVTDGNSNPVNVSGLNSSFEVTMIGGWTETVTGLINLQGQTGALATFATQPNNNEFLQILYDTNVNSNDLTGFGFNDGTEMLRGNLVGNSVGNFQISDATAVQMDGFGNDDYTGQQSVSGTGSQTTTDFDNLTQNNTFFQSQLDTFGVIFQNISIGLPFGTVNPSDCFSTGINSTQCANVHVNGLYSAQGPDANGGFVPTVGTVNGNGLGPNGRGGVDFVAQSDYNSALKSVQVPEPTSVSLIGLGLLGLAGGLRRRSKKA